MLRRDEDIYCNYFKIIEMFIELHFIKRDTIFNQKSYSSSLSASAIFAFERELWGSNNGIRKLWSNQVSVMATTDSSSLATRAAISEDLLRMLLALK